MVVVQGTYFSSFNILRYCRQSAVNDDVGVPICEDKSLVFRQYLASVVGS